MNMAGIFDKVAAGINRGVNTVSEGAKTMNEKARLNNELRDFEREKDRLLQSLGAQVYGMYSAGEIQTEQCHPICEQISICSKRINDVQRQIQDIENTKNQPKFQQTYQNVYQSVQLEAQPGGVTCSCGYTNKPGAKFCAKCGSPCAQ